MRKIYKLILDNKNNIESKNGINDKDNNTLSVITGISGALKGEKLLIKGEEIIYKTAHSDALSESLKGTKGYLSNGIYDIKNINEGVYDSGQFFIERLELNERLIVCGAGTVGQEVIRLGKMLGFYVIVIEDRQEYADIAKGNGADEVYCASFEAGFDMFDQRYSDYYVVVTREHRYDRLCIEAILKRKKSYVGMMSSRNRAHILKNDLLDAGYRNEELDLIHSPVGLNINAETPAEIAVSVLAEIIQIKNSVMNTEGYKDEFLKKIINLPDEERVILAVIVKKEGSAPREAGTKMLIYENGKISGSIGGGFIESSVIAKAKEMFATGKKSELFDIDKNSSEALLCGGYESIYMEMI